MIDLPERNMMSTSMSPLIAAGSRFPVGTGDPDTTEELSPVSQRSFLLRGAELIHRADSVAASTPKVTTDYDGQDDKQSEDFSLPDFAP